MTIAPRPVFYEQPVHTLDDSSQLTFGEWFQSRFPNGSAKHKQVITDMDGTCFVQDTAYQIYLEMFSSPDYWNYSPQEFAELLIPKKFHTTIEKISNGYFDSENHPTISVSSDIGTQIQDLYHDINKIYQHIHNIKSNSTQDNSEVLQHLLNAFARLMLEMDSLLIQAEKAFNGDLLMRIRFFGGRDIQEIRGLAQKAISGVDHTFQF